MTGVSDGLEEAISGPRRQRSRLIALAIGCVAVVAVGAWYVVDGSHGGGDMVQTDSTYSNVEATPFEVNCGLSDNSLSIHVVDVGDARWYSQFFDSRLPIDASVRGQLRILEATEPANGGLRGSDRAEFSVGGQVMAEFGPFPPSCE